IPVLGVHVAVAAAMLWSYYGFRYSAFARMESGMDGFSESWEQVLGSHDAVAPAIRTARDWRLLPEAYLFGLPHALKHAQQWPAYLNGRSSPTGWWYYFPLVFLMKSPLPTLAVLLLTAWCQVRALADKTSYCDQARLGRSLRRAWPFVLFAVIYFLL